LFSQFLRGLIVMRRALDALPASLARAAAGFRLYIKSIREATRFDFVEDFTSNLPRIIAKNQPILTRSARQLTLPLQLEFTFGTPGAAAGITTGAAAAKFNKAAEAEIQKAASALLGGKKARRALFASANPFEELNKRAGRVKLPPALLPRAIADALKIVKENGPLKKEAAKAIQSVFDFKASPAIQKSLDFTEKFKKRLTVTAARAGTGIKGGGLFAGLGKQLATFAKSSGLALRKIFSSFIRFARTTDLISKAAQGIFKLGRAFRILFSVLNGIRRFVFSASGILLILEAIILFGDKLPIVAQTLEVLGKGFRALGAGIKETFKNAIPAFQSLGIAFKRVFRGDIQGSIAAFKIGIVDLTNVIRTGLVKAWGDFLTAVEPVKDRLAAIFKGLLDTFSTIFEVLRAIFDLTGKLLPGGEGKLAGSLAAATTPEKIKVFFASINAMIREIGVAILSIIALLADAIGLLKTVLFAILRFLANVPKWLGGGSGARAAEVIATADPKTRLAQVTQLLKALTQPGALVIVPEGQTQAGMIQGLAEERQELIMQIKKEGSILDKLNATIERLRATISSNQPGGGGTDEKTAVVGAARAAAKAARGGRNALAFDEFLTGAREALLGAFTIPLSKIPIEIDPFAGQKGITPGQSVARAIAQRRIAAGETEIDQATIAAAGIRGRVITDGMRKVIAPFEDVTTSIPDIVTGMFEQVGSVFNGLVDTFFGDTSNVQAAAKEQVALLKRDTASVVGSFGNTRGQLLKVLGENNKKSEQHLENLDRNVEGVLNGPNFG